MAQPIVLQEAFTRMIQDVPRDEIPRDACWEMIDYLPDLGLGVVDGGTAKGGRCAKRGGWLYACEDVSTDSTSATSITAMGYLSSVDRLCLTTDNNKFGYFSPPGNSAANYTQVSTSSIQSLQPYVDAFGTIIIPNNDGTTTPKSYDGTTFGNLAGSPPTGKYAAVWNDRLILGNTNAQKRRTYFSALGNVASWDTTLSYLDMIRDVAGYMVLPTCLLIFGNDQTARVRGKVPPPGSPDMVLDDPIFNIGCTYPHSIAVNGPIGVFANEEGVFVTNGTSVTQDLTKICGVKNLWQVSNADRQAIGAGVGKSVDKVYGGFIGNHYMATVHASTGSNGGLAFLFNLDTKSCVLLKNFNANSVCMTPQVGDELFYGIGTRVVATSPIFTPTSDNMIDANSGGPTPSISTRYYLDDSTYRKRWKNLYLDYALVDSGGNDPTLTVTFYPNWQNTTGNLALNTLAETTAAQGTIRAKLPIRKLARGGYFDITQTNRSAQTVIAGLSAGIHAHEGGRV